MDRIEIRNKKTGKWETRIFKDSDEAFEAYWDLVDQEDPDLHIELISDQHGPKPLPGKAKARGFPPKNRPSTRKRIKRDCRNHGDPQGGAGHNQRDRRPGRGDNSGSCSRQAAPTSCYPGLYGPMVSGLNEYPQLYPGFTEWPNSGF